MAESTFARRSASRELSSSQAGLWAEEELPGARAAGRASGGSQTSGRVVGLAPKGQAACHPAGSCPEELALSGSSTWGGEGESPLSELSGGRSPHSPRRSLLPPENDHCSQLPGRHGGEPVWGQRTVLGQGACAQWTGAPHPRCPCCHPGRPAAEAEAPRLSFC